MSLYQAIGIGFFYFWYSVQPFLKVPHLSNENAKMVIKINPFASDKILIAGCKKQDRKAQKYLFEEQAPVMINVCKRYIKDHDTAEEVMLGGFMKVYQKIDQFKFEGALQGWIRKIMVNECLSWIRKNKMMYKEVDIEDMKVEPDLQVLEDKLEAQDLMNLIEMLPQGYRTVFNLYAIEGYTHDEISKQLDISVNTSKSQLSRARKYLQIRLSQLDQMSRSKRQDDGS